MAPDELALACRMAGRSLDELWVAYLELGGSRTRQDLEARLGGGAAWSDREDRYLSVVVEEALQDEGLPRLSAPDTRWAAHRRDAGGDPVATERTTAAVLQTRAHGMRLTALFERCHQSRADARATRRRAQACRHARSAATSSPTGGR